MKNGGEYEIFAPNKPQHHVINHITGEEMDEIRNVLIESARIARGKIKDLNDYNADDFDAIIFPGGFGAAKNLSGYAFDAEHFKVDPGVESVIKSTSIAGKPIGALCISPVIMAKIMNKPVLTVGDDGKTISDLEHMGAVHKKTGHGGVVVDPVNKLVTSPCYMLDADILQIADGADAAVKGIFKLF